MKQSLLLSVCAMNDYFIKKKQCYETLIMKNTTRKQCSVLICCPPKPLTKSGRLMSTNVEKHFNSLTPIFMLVILGRQKWLPIEEQNYIKINVTKNFLKLIYN